MSHLQDLYTRINSTGLQTRALIDGIASGVNLVDNVLSKNIQQDVIRHHGLQAILPRRPVIGNVHTVVSRTATVVTNATAPNVWNPDANPHINPDLTGTYTQLDYPVATILFNGQITRRMVASGRSFVDILSEEMQFLTDDAGEFIELDLLIGNGTDRMKGLLQQAVGYGQFVEAGTALGGALFTVDKLELALDKTKGSSASGDKFIAMSLAGRRVLSSALASQRRFLGSVEIDAGFVVQTYEHVPVIITTGMPDASEWNASAGGGSGTISTYTDGNIDSEVTNPTTSMLVINKRYCYIGERQPLTFKTVNPGTAQLFKFEIYADMCVVAANAKGLCALVNILV